MRALAGTAAASAIGVAKEVYDAQHQDQHTSDGDDALATAAGGAVGATLVSGVSFLASQDGVAAAVAWSF